MDKDAVAIKGTSNGLVVTLGESPFGETLAELEARLTASASFFVGGRVALRAGDRALSVEQLQQIGTLLEETGVTLWAVEADHPATNAAAQDLGLETSIQPAPAAANGALEPISREELVGIVARRTLRSGQTIRHAGHVTLVGDVNPGAEIVAAGDIFVWGKLLGTAHAGAMGDEGAVICALEMSPSQIRIGSHIARSPERSRRSKVPEMASVQDEGIVVEPWQEKKIRILGFEI